MSKNGRSGKSSSFSGDSLNSLQSLGARFGIQPQKPAEEEKKDTLYMSFPAPYNFIPFPNVVLCRYHSQEQIPGHDTLEAALLSGEIEVSVLTKTPLIYHSPEGTPDFPKNSRGQYYLPGSSLRGLVRENMQILAYGAARADRDIESQRFTYRVPASGRKKEKTQKVPYAHVVTDGLPEAHRQEVLDYPDSILGFVGEESAFRSRVSFGDLTAQGNVKQQPPLRLTQMGPKPKFCAGYIRGNEGAITDYNKDGFSLNGFKQYWLKKDVWIPEPEPVGKKSKKKPTDNEEVVTVSSPLPAGTELLGTIRYRNLHPDELGLLLGCLDLGLWRINPEEECFQSLGGGKPFGFGRVSIRVRSLREYDIGSLYRSFSVSRQPDASGERLKELMDCYLFYASDLLNQAAPAKQAKKKSENQEKKRLWYEDRIRDFFFMKQKVWEDPEPVSYMKLDDFKNVNTPLTTVRKLRNPKK